MAQLKLIDLQKKYGDTEILRDINLSIESGEFIVFVGPSGCGKSTLLRCISGLDEATKGEIHIDNQNVTDVSPAARGIAMVFQSYALYPHMSVYNNIAFNLKLKKVPADEIQKKVSEAAKIVHLSEHLDKSPKHLSGGQRQRVAIARAIVRKPKVFLFDEPLSNLDAALRTKMRIEIARLHQSLGSTMIYVTHDQTEAMTLSDRIVVLNAGKIEQVGKSMELYETPKSLFVATFIGSPQMNIVNVNDILNNAEIKANKPSAVKIGIRPEHLQLTTKEKALISGEVSLAEVFGEYNLIYIETSFNQTIVVKVPPQTAINKKETLFLTADKDHLHFFDKGGISI